jgi:hypothetical protein
MILLLILVFFQSRELKKLKGMFKVDEAVIKAEATALLQTEPGSKVAEILRKKHYPTERTVIRKLVQEAQMEQQHALKTDTK